MTATTQQAAEHKGGIGAFFGGMGSAR